VLRVDATNHQLPSLHQDRNAGPVYHQHINNSTSLSMPNNNDQLRMQQATIQLQQQPPIVTQQQQQQQQQSLVMQQQQPMMMQQQPMMMQQQPMMMQQQPMMMPPVMYQQPRPRGLDANYMAFLGTSYLSYLASNRDN